MEDPFLLDQNKVEGQLERMRPQFERWRQLRDCERPPFGTDEREDLEEEFHCLTNELTTSVRAIGWDIDDLQETLGLMLKNKSPSLSLASDRDSRAAFLARVRGFLDEVAREIAMANLAVGLATQVQRDVAEEEIDLEANLSQKQPIKPDEEYPAPAKAAMPLISWRKDTAGSSSLSFPTVELNSLQDLRRRNRLYERDWTGCVYRYRYLLAMLGIICLIVFVTVVALAAKHTASSSATTGNALTTVGPQPTSCPPGWKKTLHLCNK